MSRAIEAGLKAISRFSTVMLEKLNENREKRHWGECDTDWLYVRVQEEVAELAEAIEDYFEVAASGQSQAALRDAQIAVRRECADVANFCMMISDNLDPARLRDD